MLFLILALCVGLNPIIRSQNVEITKRQMELVKNVTRVLDAAIKGNSVTTKINNKMKLRTIRITEDYFMRKCLINFC